MKKNKVENKYCHIFRLIIKYLVLVYTYNNGSMNQNRKPRNWLTYIITWLFFLQRCQYNLINDARATVKIPYKILYIIDLKVRIKITKLLIKTECLLDNGVFKDFSSGREWSQFWRQRCKQNESEEEDKSGVNLSGMTA